MKDYNVLEAKDLCVNGNPVDYELESPQKPIGILNTSATFEIDRISVIKSKLEKDDFGLYTHAENYQQNREGLGRFIKTETIPKPPKLRTIKGNVK